MDRDQAYQRARNAGVSAQIIPGVSAKNWSRIKTMCGHYQGLYPAYGMHPMFLHDHTQGDIELLDAWLDGSECVAVGECGLDFYIEDPQRTQQQMWFESQLALAQNHGLPVIVHARRAVEEVILTLRRFPSLSGVLHSFSGSEQQARLLIDMGFLLSFGGPVTYPNARRLRSLVAVLPLDAVMLESDAPDQPDVDNRGGRNEPALLGRVLSTFADLRSETAGEIATATTANAQRLFRIP